MAKLEVLLLSNGHGEDVVGIQLARDLKKRYPQLVLSAYPTVGNGRAYAEAGISLAGTHRALPSGGLLFHSWQLFLADVRAGLLAKTLRQVWELGRLEPDVIITVGDAYALLLSARVRAKRRFYVQTLVSAYHAEGAANPQANRRFMERFDAAELSLMRRYAEHIYVRDKATADVLHLLDIEHASAVGNPVVDQVTAGQIIETCRDSEQPVVALLPGTRAYRYKALETMMASFRELPSGTGLLAWTGGILPLFSGWTRLEGDENNLKYIYQHGNKKVFVYENRFADILHTAQLVLGTAGTANEQAAALGKPIVAFSVPPFYSAAFLENQKRLLADALVVTNGHPEAVADRLWSLHTEPQAYERAARAGQQRMGKAGGSAAIVADIAKRTGLKAEMETA